MSQTPPPQQPYPQQPPPHYNAEPHLPAPGVALAAMITGILAILTSPLLLFGIVALIVGLVAVAQTGAHTGRKGRGMAIAGTVMGGSSLVLGLVVVLLIGIMLPALGAARRTARRMQNSTQLRGVHQGMVTFGNSNKENFPGLTSKGNILEDAAEITGMSGHGGTTEARMWILLDGNFFTPEYAISPSETSAVTEYNTGMLDTTAVPVEFTAGTTGLRHYSYAFLAIHQDATVPNDTTTPDWEGRASEWTQSLNTQAVVAGDRNTGRPGLQNYSSVHTNGSGEWKGQVLWNDNHVMFEQTPYFVTRYGNGELNGTYSGEAADDIFALNDNNVNDDDHNAFLVCDGQGNAFSQDQ